MAIVVFAVAAFALVIVLAAVGLIFASRRLAAAGQALIAAQFTTDQIVQAAPLITHYGLASGASPALRGTGVLVLTHDLLWASTLKSEATLSIPRASVLEAQVMPSRVDRTGTRGVLQVRYQGPTGEERASFYLREPAQWAQALQGAMR